MIKQFIFIILVSFTTSNIIKTSRIYLNEEVDADTRVVNLTQLIHSILNKTIHINSIKFSHENDLVDYFKLETNQFSFNTEIIDSIELKTSGKRLDRETLCATQANEECLVSLKLNAQLEGSLDLDVELLIEINDINDNKPAFYQSEIKIDIDLNKPIQTIKIPLKLAYDLDSTRANRIQNYSISKSFDDHLQIKYNQRSLVLILNTTDLNVTQSELVELKAFDSSYETTQLIQFNFNLKPKFQIFEKNFYNLTLSNVIRIKVNKQTNQQCDPEFSALNAKVNKPVRAEFKLDANYLDINLFGRLNQLRLVAKCGENLNDSAFFILNEVVNTSALFNLNLVSAMNDLDINETNNIIEFKFKSTDAVVKSKLASSSSTNSLNSSFVTLAYLIAEQQAQPQLFYSSNVKYKLNREINKLDDKYHDLIKIDEMRNGLYAFKISSKYLDLIRVLNNQNVDKRSSVSTSVQYTLKLNLLVNEPDLTIQRMIKLNLPSMHLIQTNTNDQLLSKTIRKETSSSSSSINQIVPVTPSTFLTSFNLFNSVVLITVISVVLILIALACFIISLSLYLKSKCRQMKEINKTKDELINVKLNDKKLYNLSGSSSIELGSAESGISSGQPSSSSSTSDLSSNNSTITTTTNNGFNQNNRTSWIANNAIMVYDVMPSKSNQSSSASSNYQNSSNISPVTTTSGVESALSNSSSIRNAKQSLLQLSAKQLESDYENNSNNSKDVMYKWYMNTTNELIRPLPLKPQQQPPLTNDTCDGSSLNVEYRNEIYRNSHLIFKNNSQYCQLKKTLPVLMKKSATDESKNEDFKTYEAKPINLNREIYSPNSNEINSPSTTTTNNINTSSSLENYDSVNFDNMSTNSLNFLTKDKMLNRLSTANSVSSSSENSSTHQQRILNSSNYVKTSLSLIDSEQQISSV